MSNNINLAKLVHGEVLACEDGQPTMEFAKLMGSPGWRVMEFAKLMGSPGWRGGFPFSNSVANLIAPKLTIEDIANRLYKANLVHREEAKYVAQSLTKQHFLTSSELRYAPEYLYFRRCTNPSTGQECYKLVGQMPLFADDTD